MSFQDLENNINETNKRIFSLFQTDIESILKNKFEWMVQMRTPTNVIDTWFYWEYEQYIKYLNEKNKEESEQRKKQSEEESGKYKSIQNFNPSSMMNKYNPSKIAKNFGSMGSNSAFPRI